jgi:hypothetical protein
LVWRRERFNRIPGQIYLPPGTVKIIKSVPVSRFLLILVIRDRLDKLTTLPHFFLSMLSAESGNQHFLHPAIYFIIGMGHHGIGNLAGTQQEIPDLGYLNSNVGDDRT